jgi:hypothetical protein
MILATAARQLAAVFLDLALEIGSDYLDLGLGMVLIVLFATKCNQMGLEAV